MNRRWLLAYPRSYRRERGEEILATVVESGRSGPPVAANLVRHGLRARLGRPVSRTVVFWSLATALICGLFAATLATWVVWTNSRPHPSEAEARAVLADVFPGQHFADIWVPPAVFTFYSQPLSWSNLDQVLSLDGGEYELAATGGGVQGAPATGGDPVTTTALARLDAGGWRISPPVVAETIACGTKMCENPQPSTHTTITAERDGVLLTVGIFADAGPEETFIWAGLQRMAPATVWPAGIVGFVIGAALAWLLFAWASRRTDAGHPAAGGVKLCFGVAVLCWWGPALLAGPFTLTHHLGEPHPQLHPLWEWLGQPVFGKATLVGVGFAAVGLALALLPRRARRATGNIVAD